MLIQNVLPLVAGLLALALGLWSVATGETPRWLGGGQRPRSWGLGMILVSLYAASLFRPLQQWSDGFAGPYASLRIALLLLGLLLVTLSRLSGGRNKP